MRLGRAGMHPLNRFTPPREFTCRRFLVLIALKTSARFYQRTGPCIPISKNHIVKTGPYVQLAEATTLEFIATKTSIPVPRVRCAFVHRNQAYIVMTRIRGDPLPTALRTLSGGDLDHVFGQLKEFFNELRALPPPGLGVGSCTGGSLRDTRIPHSGDRFGPFSTVQEFHTWLRKGVQLEDLESYDGPERNEIREMIAKQDGPWLPPVFTHGDLNPFNILVRDGQVVGIVDWDFAGWYPSYWEYTSAWCGNQTRQAWQEMISKFLDAYPEELKMELIRQKWWGDT